MKHLRYFFGLLAFASLTGCATLSQSDAYLLREHHVNPSLYERMSHKDFLSLSDIIELSQRQVPPAFIIHYLGSIGATYHLSSSEVVRLRKAGVNKDVVDYLLATGTAYAPRPYGYYARPVYPYASPYYAPYPYYGGYGYPTVIVGGGYYYGGGYGRHWR